MGMLDGTGSAPQITPDIMAPVGQPQLPMPPLPRLQQGAPAQAPQPMPQQLPQQQQDWQQNWRALGLKKPAPAIGTTVEGGHTYLGGDPRDTNNPNVWKQESGDAYLNSLSGLDDEKKTLVKMMASYDAPASGARGIGSPEVQQLVSIAKRYDPSFDIKQYKVRQDYLKTLTEGKANGTIQALSNAALHLKSYDDEFQKLGNWDLLPEWANAAKQGLVGSLGGSTTLKASNAAKTDATIAGPEIARVAEGGAPTMDASNRQLENLGAGGNWFTNILGSGIGLRPSSEAGTVSAMAQKVGDRLLTMQAQQRRAFGDKPPTNEPLITPEAADALHQLLTRYAPDYEKKLDYRMLTAGGYSPPQARSIQSQGQPQRPSIDNLPRKPSGTVGGVGWRIL